MVEGINTSAVLASSSCICTSADGCNRARNAPAMRQISTGHRIARAQARARKVPFGVSSGISESWRHDTAGQYRASRSKRAAHSTGAIRVGEYQTSHTARAVPPSAYAGTGQRLTQYHHQYRTSRAVPPESRTWHSGRVADSGVWCTGMRGRVG
eukprot:1361791-Rhodomonas_salina.4